MNVVEAWFGHRHRGAMPYEPEGYGVPAGQDAWLKAIWPLRTQNPPATICQDPPADAIRILSAIFP
jgi:hypothetical protein